MHNKTDEKSLACNRRLKQFSYSYQSLTLKPLDIDRKKIKCLLDKAMGQRWRGSVMPGDKMTEMYCQAVEKNKGNAYLPQSSCDERLS